MNALPSRVDGTVTHGSPTVVRADRRTSGCFVGSSAGKDDRHQRAFDAQHGGQEQLLERGGHRASGLGIPTLIARPAPQSVHRKPPANRRRPRDVGRELTTTCGYTCAPSGGLSSRLQHGNGRPVDACSPQEHRSAPPCSPSDGRRFSEARISGGADRHVLGDAGGGSRPSCCRARNPGHCPLLLAAASGCPDSHASRALSLISPHRTMCAPRKRT